LGTLRATLIPAVAVPVSVIGSFAILLLMGYSANTISLLAMVLAIGILVDDAIVVVENVERVLEEEPDLSPADATKKAMAEITGPILAITLVLFSVFVPIAFIPGVSGTLFRQFAVTISVAMAISALNALTLSPALCAVFLRRRGPRRGAMGWVLRRIDDGREGYAAIVTRLVRVSFLGVVAVLGAAAGIYLLSSRTPTGFLPEEDQGAFFISVQLPDGASVSRTSQAVKRIEALLRAMPQVQNIFAIIGFSIIDGVNESNAAFVVPTLKPFADRVGAASSAQALIARVFREGQEIRAANVIPFNLPPIIGLSTTGGFEYRLEGLEGQDPAVMNSVMQGLLAAANRDPRLTRVFSTFTASNPSIYLNIDRAKAQALGLNMSDVFSALQATLGGIYINNFNLYGRVWPIAPTFRRCGGSIFATNTVRPCRWPRLRMPGSFSGLKSSPATTITARSRSREARRPAYRRARRSRGWRKSRPKPCRPALAMSGPAPLIRSRRRRARPERSSAWRSCLRSCFWLGSTKAG
jgi:multidrug efflux pump subunit AcrB